MSDTPSLQLSTKQSLERQLEYVAKIVDDLNQHATEAEARMRVAVSEGVRDGILACAADPEFMRRFWRSGYDELTKHGRDDVSRSVGRRVLSWSAGLAFAAALYLSAKAGLIK
jgi:hypothetical protein